MVGPTATGKSDLGVRLALELGGEIVNADAMQLYRGMDIGTAKLTTAQRRGVAHHQLDVLDVTQTASVAAYQSAARTVVERLLARGRVPIIVGGSGLYVRALIDDLEFPGTDPAVREHWETELARVGAEALHRDLAVSDPVAAAAILPSNGRRIVRALEVIELTGRPFSATMPRPGPARYGTVLIGLDLAASAVDERVDRRVDAMFAAGLRTEVESLLPLGLREGRTACRALGYRQVLAAIDGEFDMDTARIATAQVTRRFVRRQRSWFRRDRRIEWLDAGRPDLLAAVKRQGGVWGS
ncbi:MAG: tRNA (adenosine(37)-N6)-dimethylallyltransferase MiaA [Sciscionella sp.]